MKNKIIWIATSWTRVQVDMLNARVLRRRPCTKNMRLYRKEKLARSLRVESGNFGQSTQLLSASTAAGQMPLFHSKHALLCLCFFYIHVPEYSANISVYSPLYFVSRRCRYRQYFFMYAPSFKDGKQWTDLKIWLIGFFTPSSFAQTKKGQ